MNNGDAEVAEEEVSWLVYRSLLSLLSRLTPISGLGKEKNRLSTQSQVLPCRYTIHRQELPLAIQSEAPKLLV